MWEGSRSPLPPSWGCWRRRADATGSANQRRRRRLCARVGRRGSGGCIAARFKSDCVLTPPRSLAGDAKATRLHQPSAQCGGTGPTSPLVGLGTKSQPPSPPMRAPERKENGSPNVRPPMGRPVVGHLPPLRLVAPHPYHLPSTLWPLRGASGRHVCQGAPGGGPRERVLAGTGSCPRRSQRQLAGAGQGALLGPPVQTINFDQRVTADPASAKRGGPPHVADGFLQVNSTVVRWFVVQSTFATSQTR